MMNFKAGALIGVATGLVLASGPSAAGEPTPTVDTFYGEAGEPFTLVVGEGSPGSGVVEPKVLEFRDKYGERARVYSDRTVSLREGADAIERSRRARLEVEQADRVLKASK